MAAEADRINSGILVAATAVIIAALIAMVFFAATLFDFAVHDEINRKVNALESKQLKNLRIDEHMKMTRYQWMDQTKGVVRIPVERAVEMMMAEGYKRPPAPDPAPAAPAAPAPKPAAAAGH